jgi:drug/metabolite transporter (DMT)-like permease
MAARLLSLLERLGAPISLSGVTFTIYIGALSSFAGFVFHNWTIAGKTCSFVHLMPVFGTLFSALFLGEIPHVPHGDRQTAR